MVDHGFAGDISASKDISEQAKYTIKQEGEHDRREWTLREMIIKEEGDHFEHNDEPFVAIVEDLTVTHAGILEEKRQSNL